MLRILSLGAGVQSTTLALMSARRDLPALDCAIFADTGWESSEVYTHLDWLEKQLPYPVYRVQRKGLDLGELVLAIAAGKLGKEGSSMPPLFVKDPNGRLPTQCSKEFKTRVVGRKVSELVGLEPGERGPKKVIVEQWLGLSADEMWRMKDAEKKWTQNRFPLIELGLKRHHCLRWMEERQYPKPPRSSCIFCMNRTQAEWRHLRDNLPEDWARAVAFDAAIRGAVEKGQAFVHKDLVPLDQADLSTPADRGQIEFGFLQECEGMCGV
jgi:hypothetical protein